MKKIPAKYRKFVYGTAAVVSVALLFGYVTPNQISDIAKAVTQVLLIFSSVLALNNVTPDEPKPTPEEGEYEPFGNESP